MSPVRCSLLALVATVGTMAVARAAEPLLAGVAKVDITERDVARVNDPLYAKALVLKQGDQTAVLLTLDVVAIGEIGRVPNDFLAKLRQQLAKGPGIEPANVLVNASHCHGTPRADTLELAVQAVREAAAELTPVRVGVGVGHEDRISENRRLPLHDGSQADMRRAYALPWDDAVAAVGPIDPKIGLLRLDRLDGRPLAVVYHFACHPIMNPPSKGNSADFPGFASALLEDALGEGALALFVQGCGGDINPVRYKEAHLAPDAEPLGHALGASVLRGLAEIETDAEADLIVARRSLTLPRAKDYPQRIAAIEAEQQRLVKSLRPTNIGFKTFLPLLIQHRLGPDFPTHHKQSYLHDAATGNDELTRLDADNRAQIERYLGNIEIMERLTQLNTNLALLKRQLAKAEEAGTPTIDVEVNALRVGGFQLVTFPGEVTVEVGLRIQKLVDHPYAFVSGYTNGYIYYTPTAAQRRNSGYAQEDCDCMVAPGWQPIFGKAAVELFGEL